MNAALLRKIQQVNGIIDVDVLHRLCGIDIQVPIATIAAVIVAITLGIRLLNVLMGPDWQKPPHLLYRILADACVVVLFFIGGMGYMEIMRSIYGMQQWLFEVHFSDALTTYTAQIHYLCAQLYMTEQSGLYINAVGWFNASALDLINGLGVTMLIVISWMFLHVFQIFFCITLLCGPVLAAFYFVFPGVLHAWVRLAIFAAVYPVVMGATVQVLTVMQTHNAAAVAITGANPVALAAVVFMGIITISCIPALAGMLFGIPILGFISKVMFEPVKLLVFMVVGRFIMKIIMVPTAKAVVSPFVLFKHMIPKGGRYT